MLSQVVVNQPYGNLGGNEGIGRRGGYYNYAEHFPTLWKDPNVQRWLRKKQDATRAEYLSRFEKFLSWSSSNLGFSTPASFLEWANSQPNGNFIQDVIDQYGETQLKSNAHIATALLRSFLSRNACKVVLPKIEWDSTMNYTEGYKRDEIQELVKYLPQPIHKLFVTFSKDSGLRANDTLYVRYKHIQKDLEAGQKYVHVEFEKERYQRKKAPGRTFIGPNTLELLGHLFDNGTVTKDPEAKLFDFSYRNIAKLLANAKKFAGVDPKIQPSHGLRKFFENQLDRTGMDVDKKRQLEGHSSGVRNAYTSRDIDGLRELYEGAYQYLDLSEEAVVSKEIKDLQKDNKALKEDIADKETLLRTVLARLEKLEKRLPPDEQAKD